MELLRCRGRVPLYPNQESHSPRVCGSYDILPRLARAPITVWVQATHQVVHSKALDAARFRISRSNVTIVLLLVTANLTYTFSVTYDDNNITPTPPPFGILFFKLHFLNHLNHFTQHNLLLTRSVHQTSTENGCKSQVEWGRSVM